jgi:CheY-like chemotaxis protein
MFEVCRTVITPQAIEKNLTLRFYTEPVTGRILYGDPARLRQVFINLLSNAVKFTDKGVIELNASVKNGGDKSVTMRFEVKDTGIGMTPEQTEKIFEPFMQAETGTARKYGGSGLGLAITKNIVEMMNGRISVESAPGAGSAFSFEITFDAAYADGKNEAVAAAGFEEIKKPAFRGEVLLCEDNIMNQQVIYEHLARVGLSAVIAENGKAGVDMVSDRMRKGENQFDLIFMDIHMPVMDGLESAAKIMELDASIPIIAMTANVMPGDRELYRAAGMNDCVGKPFTSQELWRCLLKYLKPASPASVSPAPPEEILQKV